MIHFRLYPIVYLPSIIVQLIEIPASRAAFHFYIPDSDYTKDISCIYNGVKFDEEINIAKDFLVEHLKITFSSLKGGKIIVFVLSSFFTLLMFTTISAISFGHKYVEESISYHLNRLPSSSHDTVHKCDVSSFHIFWYLIRIRVHRNCLCFFRLAQVGLQT